MDVASFGLGRGETIETGTYRWEMLCMESANRQNGMARLGIVTLPKGQNPGPGGQTLKSGQPGTGGFTYPCKLQRNGVLEGSGER